MRDLVIIGGGAAGLSAAMLAFEKDLDVLVVADHLGGKAGTQQHLLAQHRPEYLAGAEMVRGFERHLAARDSAVLRDHAEQVERAPGGLVVHTQHSGPQYARCVLLATGAAPVRLEVPGAQRLLNYGIGYSATSHTHLLAGKVAAVVGGSRRALLGAADLARLAERVVVVLPEGVPLDEGARWLQRQPRVELRRGCTLAAIEGELGVERIRLVCDGVDEAISVDAVFADVGLLPSSGPVRDIARLDARGFVVVNQHGATSDPGLFAAGDVTTLLPEHILVAIGDGARAAQSAHRYLLMGIGDRVKG